MRKPLALLTIAALSLVLVGCSSTPEKATGSHTPKAKPSASPSTTPTVALAKPASTTPLTALKSAEILGYCPAIDAVHFQGKPADVSHASICGSEPVTGGTTESAYDVNFGLEQLLTAYSAPNETVKTSGCSKVALDPLIVWLTKPDGTIYAVYAPVTGCGSPTDAAAAAYAAVGKQILYQLSVDANGNPLPGQ
jgi:hypothetical protein